MTERSSKVRNLKVKITDATKSDRKFIYDHNLEFGNSFNQKPIIPLKTFIAKHGDTIVGFGRFRIYKKNAIIDMICTRTGFEGQRVARTIIGKINAYLVQHKVVHSELKQDLGASPKTGKKTGFYAEKTNYRPMGVGAAMHDWIPVMSVRSRKPKQKPANRLAPQNLLRPEARLLRRGKR